MTTKVVMRKIGRGLVAEDQTSRDFLAAIKNGTEVTVQIKAPRNPVHHRLFMKLLSMIVEAGAWPYDVDSLLIWCKFRLGHVKRFSVGNRTFTVPKSIAFEEMGQPEFKKFFDRAIFYLCEEIIGTEDWESLRNEVLDACRDRRLDSQEQAYRDGR